MRLVALGLVLSLGGCRAPSADPPQDQPASPQAKAEPAPIDPAASSLRASASSSAGSPFVPPPEPMRPDEPPTADVFPRDGGLKEGPAVYGLTLVLHPSDVALPSKGFDLSPAGLEAARRKTDPVIAIDLAPAHARAVLKAGFVLPEGTEIRARSDRFGYVVVSPDGLSYRVAATGSLRALLGEGLFDVAPSAAAAEVSARGDGPRRLGRATRRVEVVTRAARAAFELAKVPELGDGGVLVCRMILDLMSAAPTTTACVDGDVPLHVELKWIAPPTAVVPGRIAGVATFDAALLVRRGGLFAAALGSPETSPTVFLTPPPAMAFVATGSPVTGSRLFLSHGDVVALHAGSESPPGHVRDATLTLRNSTDELRYAWLDGVPLAWLAPGAQLDVAGVPQGRAFVQWRTFLGDAIDPGQTVLLPASLDVGAAPVPAQATSADNPPP